MVHPANFEEKIGFDEIRRQLKGRCLSSLGTEWIDREVTFRTEAAAVRRALSEAGEFARFLDEGEETETDFFDVRQALLHARPERTRMEETALFDLKRSIVTLQAYRQAFLKGAGDEDGEGTVAYDDAPEAAEAAGGDSCDAPESSAAPQPAYAYPALAAMAADVAVFPQIVARIDAVLNVYGKVKDTASPKLLTLRHEIETTTRSISHSLRNLISRAQSDGYIDRDVAPTLRDGRLVIPVPPAMKRKVGGIVHDESATGKTLFIEPTVIVEANNRIRELRAAESREVMRILQELTDLIRPHIGELLSSLRFLAHIDYLRALTSLAANWRGIIPEVSDRPAIDWVAARHPLLEQSLARHGGQIVPLDVTLGEGRRILLISGPNAGGKSVCLKTVALLQYMLQCGMPVPAGEASRPGIFTDLMIDIGDAQSLEDDLSTYSSHLLNMKTMMQHAGGRSLLLIDEFGGGTEPQIGGALAEAMLGRFVKAGAWGIITTHYQNLKHYAASQRAIVNGAMLYDHARMRPLYQLQIGTPGSSFALEIARNIGIPADVIDYAKEAVGENYVMSDKYVQDIVRDKKYWERKRRDIHDREKRLEETVARYERQLTEVKEEKQRVIAEARAKAEDLLKASNAKVEQTIRAIKEAQAERERTRAVRSELEAFKQEVAEVGTPGAGEENDKIARQLAKLERRRQRRAEGKSCGGKRAATAAGTGTAAPAAAAGSAARSAAVQSTAPLAVGDYVRIKGQSAVGRIESLAAGGARVLFGMIHSNVKLDRLERAEAPREEANKVGRTATFVSEATRNAMTEKRLNFRPDIDIRGKRADEALDIVSHYIDDAIQCEQSRVRILHGTGGGVLRELVRDYLATVPGVNHFHDEQPQFGGAGITVVDLA